MTDFSEDAEKNPAAQADGKSLAELFASDPLDLTAEDRAVIIKKLRQQRTQHVQEDAEKKTKQTKGAASKQAAQDLNIDVDDIDI
jgi:hypothetical protein